jgi:hypothetical protein
MQLFLDIEASSLHLGSHPIEVAWVREDGQSEAYLIRPAPEWDDWSPESQRVHGISREMLARDGKPHGWVAQRASDALRGVTVLSDAPGFDAAWLGRLLEAAGLPRIPMLPVQQAYGAACRPLLARVPPEDDTLAGRVRRERALVEVRTLAGRIVMAAEQEAEMRSGARHRALPDAEHLWRVWSGVRRRVAKEVGPALAGP